MENLQNGSARVSLPALPPPELLAAAMELSAPIVALATKRAITSPLIEPEGRLGIVEEPAPGDERGGATGSAGHESRARGREPWSSENQPHDEEHEAHEQLEKLAADGARLAGRVEVREHGDAGE